MAHLGTHKSTVHGTTTGDGTTVDTATVGGQAQNQSRYVEVEVDEAATVPVYFRVDGTDPGVGADGSFKVAPGRRRVKRVGGGATTVALISSAAADVSVTVLPDGEAA